MHIDIHVTPKELADLETDAEKLSESIRSVIEGGISDDAGTIYLTDVRVSVNVLEKTGFIATAQSGD